MSEHKTVIERIDIIESLLHKILKNQINGNPEAMLTRKDIVERYKVSTGTIHNAMNKGELMFYKIGSKTLFKKAEVDEWVLR